MLQSVMNGNLMNATIDDHVESVDGNNVNKQPNTDNNIKKRTWTITEDRQLLQLIEIHGALNWTKISQMMTDRSGKQCHNRWNNCLNPDIKKGEWTKEEDTIILDSFQELGKQWAKISSKLVGRNPLSVKNRYFSLLASNRKRNFDDLILSKIFLKDCPNSSEEVTRTCVGGNPYFHNYGYDKNGMTQSQSQSPLITTFDSARTDNSDSTTSSNITNNNIALLSSTDILTSTVTHPGGASKRKRSKAPVDTLQAHPPSYLFPDVLYPQNNNHQYNSHPHHHQLQLPQYLSNHSNNSQQSVGFQVITPCTATYTEDNNNYNIGSLSSIFGHENIINTQNEDDKDDNDMIHCDDLSILTEDKRDGVVIDNPTTPVYTQQQQRHEEVNIEKSRHSDTTAILHSVQDENRNNSNYNQIILPITDVLSPLIIKPILDIATTNSTSTFPPPAPTITTYSPDSIKNNSTSTNPTNTNVLLKPVPGHPYLFYDVSHPVIQKIQQSFYC